MELSVQLDSNVLVLPPKAIPTVDTTYSDANQGCSVSSLLQRPSHRPAEPSSTLNGVEFDAEVILKVASGQPAGRVLTSLSVRLVGLESITHTNGGFDQWRPVNVLVKVPQAERLWLESGRTYTFAAKIPCPESMPPSLCLRNASCRYRVWAKAKVHNIGTKYSRLRPKCLSTKTLSHFVELTVVQAFRTRTLDPEPPRFLNLQGLGTVCLSVESTLSLDGGSCILTMTMAEAAVQGSIDNVRLVLTQDSHISSCFRTHLVPGRQGRSRLFFDLDKALDLLPRPAMEERHHLVADQVPHSATGACEIAYTLPAQSQVQASTTAASHSMVHLSHHLRIEVRYRDPNTGEARNSAQAVWPVTLVHRQGLVADPDDQLPIYVRSEDQLPEYSPP